MITNAFASTPCFAVAARRAAHRLGQAIGVASTLVATALYSVAAVAADEITLRVKGGEFAITGDLRGFDGQRYTVFSSSLGNITLDAARFDCVKGNCPSASAAVSIPTAATPADRPLAGRTAIVGSPALGIELMPALVQHYAKSAGLTSTRIVDTEGNAIRMQLKAQDREAGLVSIERSSLNDAFQKLGTKVASIAMATRPIKPDEANSLRQAGLGDMRAPGNEHVLALDGLLTIVAAKNSAVSLSLNQIAQIYAGQITNWSQLGLPDGKITVLSPAVDTGTFDTFNALVLQPRGLELGAQTQKLASETELSDQVARDPTAIGVVGFANLRNAKALNIESSCGLITRPSRFVMKTEEYPLTRRLYLYAPSTQANEFAKGLVRFVTSAAAQETLRASDFVDQLPESLAFKNQTSRIAHALNAPTQDFDLDRMRLLISEITPAERLSLTFRFVTGSYALDTRARQDIVRLRDLLKSVPYQNKSVMLIGFADSVGNFAYNQRLSVLRAQAVRRALLSELGEAAEKNIREMGFSELAPVACNDTPQSRSFNRRVEVWLRG